MRDLPGKGIPWGWTAVLVLSCFALAPLTYPGYFETWSGFGPVYALQDLAAGRPAAIWGIGWPTPFQGGPDGPFAWLLALGLFRLGGGAALAVRWLLGISMASGMLGSYAWLRQRWGAGAALIGALGYVYAPYFLSAAYARGAVAEVVALGLAPWLFWLVGRGADADEPPVATGHSGTALLGLALGSLLLYLTLPGMAVLLALPLAWNVGRGLRGWPRGAAWAVLLAAAMAGIVNVVANGWGVGAPITLYRLLAIESPLHNPWAVGLVPWATALGVGLLVFTGEKTHRSDATAWLVWFVLACALALFWPMGSWSPLVLATLAVGPLLALLVSAVPWGRRWDLRAGIVALVILSATSALAPSYTRLEPDVEPLALWQMPGGGRLALVTQELSLVTEPEAGVELALQWQIWGWPDQDFVAFVHLVDGEGEIVAQWDGVPQDGDRPTTSWRPGEIVADAPAVWLAEGELLKGPARIALGWYGPATGERLLLLRSSLEGAPDHKVWINVP